MDINLLLTYIITVIVFLITPGPIILMMINIGVRHSPACAIKAITGTNLSSLILIALSFLMLNGLISIHHNILSIFTILGAFYLILMAIDLLKTAPIKNTLNINNFSYSQTDTLPTIKNNFFIKGFILGISNPKDLLFFMFFFPTFFDVMDQPNQAITLLTGIWVILDFSILSLIALLFYKFISARIGNIFSKLSAILLLGIAIYAIVSNSIMLLN